MTHQAPAVTLRGHTDHGWALACRVGGICVAAGISAWWLLLWQHHAEASYERIWIPVLAWALAGALWPLTADTPWTLCWDGSRWQYGLGQARTEAVDVAVVLDWDGWLLLRIGTLARPTWLALSRRMHRHHWHALRCALYCPRPTGKPPTEPDASAH